MQLAGFDKGINTMQCNEDSHFKKPCQENWTSRNEIMKLELNLTTCKKVNSKFIKELNIASETMKPLAENIEENFKTLKWAQTKETKAK